MADPRFWLNVVWSLRYGLLGLALLGGLELLSARHPSRNLPCLGWAVWLLALAGTAYGLLIPDHQAVLVPAFLMMLPEDFVVFGLIAAAALLGAATFRHDL